MLVNLGGFVKKFIDAFHIYRCMQGFSRTFLRSSRLNQTSKLSFVYIPYQFACLKEWRWEDGIEWSQDPHPFSLVEKHPDMCVRNGKLMPTKVVEKKEKKVLPRFELGSWDSESQVLTITP